MKKLLLSICVVFVSLNADGMELATITQFIEQKVTQRIIPPIQQEFDHVHDTISDQGRQIEENTDENSRKFTEFERAIRSQDIAIHELKNMLIKEAVGYAFAFGEIKAELMPHHINETSNDIIQKPTIHERHKAVFTIYNQLKLLKKVLPQNELKVVEDYANDTSIKEKVVIQAPVKPSPMPQLPANNKLKSEIQWESGRARINYIMRSWLREMGITDFALGSFKAGGWSPEEMHYRYSCKPRAIAEYNKRLKAYEEELGTLASRRAECDRQYQEDVARAERVAFPMAELDDLITKFNGLLTLND